MPREHADATDAAGAGRLDGLGALGAPIAAREVPPAAWAAGLVARRSPLVLAPGSSAGWFGGCAVVACDPIEVVTAGRAGELLDDVFGCRAPRLAAAVLDYEGTQTAVVYEHGLVLAPDGWRPWGDWSRSPEAVPAKVSPLPPDAPLVKQASWDMDGPPFREAVRTIRELVAAGDVYVLNLTLRIAGGAAAAVPSMFASLVSRTDADMAALLRLGRRSVVSASPERFLMVRGREVEVQPIKGTRPRGFDAATDASLARELAESVKERAEHVMIVDLERNDLGRVCAPGSVGVTPLAMVFATPYCHQMVSRVRGTLRPGVAVSELLPAAFPCGSVTGAPKIAAMRAIAALERSARGAYTGSLVVVVPGELDSSVLIRTAEVEAGALSWGTGGGITFDSDPAEEYLEALLKAVPLLGDGAPPVTLLETCRVVGGAVPLWPYHKARLASGGCGPTLLAAVEEEVRAALAQGESARESSSWNGCGPERSSSGRNRLRVLVHPDGTASARVDRAASSLDVAGGPGWRAVDVGASPALPPAAAKPADRGYWDDAQRRAAAGRAPGDGSGGSCPGPGGPEASPGANQAVLVGPGAVVIDGATATVWAVFGNRLVTPPAPPAVAGVARAVVLELAPAAGLAPEVRALAVADLDAADEIVFTNALAGAVGARGRTGPVARRLSAMLEETFGSPPQVAARVHSA